MLKRADSAFVLIVSIVAVRTADAPYKQVKKYLSVNVGEAVI